MAAELVFTASYIISFPILKLIYGNACWWTSFSGLFGSFFAEKRIGGGGGITYLREEEFEILDHLSHADRSDVFLDSAYFTSLISLKPILSGNFIVVSTSIANSPLMKEGGPLPLTYNTDGIKFKEGTTVPSSFEARFVYKFIFGQIYSTRVPNYPVSQLNTGVTLPLVFSELSNSVFWTSCIFML